MGRREENMNNEHHESHVGSWFGYRFRTMWTTERLVRAKPPLFGGRPTDGPFLFFYMFTVI